MAAYVRVSSDHEEQLLSYENQLNYYRNYINNNPLYEFVNIYADEAITGTNTKKRDGFKQMIQDCRDGKIDIIITKSISRFARNTLDTLIYVRELKNLGIGVIFEKENIDTLDAKGEVLLTILSSLAQDESRSISENSTWGIRKRFEAGQFKMSTKRFLGYDNDENGNLIINPKQAKIVKRIYEEFLSGKTVEYIKKMFEREGVKNWHGKAEWHVSTLQSILQNEKYKGDAILQKSYTVDFLTKKRVKNKGEIQRYCVEEDHEAIIDASAWEATQLEFQRRKQYMKEHGLKAYSMNVEKNPFSGKIICGSCGKAYGRKGWTSSNGIRNVWQCSERYKKKGVMGCSNRHVDEETLEKAFISAWNSVIENIDNYREKWILQSESDDTWVREKAKQYLEISDRGIRLIEKFDIDLMLKVLECIEIFEDGRLIVRFYDGSDVEHDSNA